MKALIIIDVQNDFLPGGPLEVKNGNEIIPVINKIQNKFDLIVATQDWHPKEHKSFAVNNNKKPGEIIQLNGKNQIMWPAHCIQETKGADFAKDLNITKIKKVFKKGTNIEIDSYSGFFDNNHKKSTGLNEYLKRCNVSEVYITGLATDVCVKFTALDAVKLGFNTYVIEDACKGVNLNKEDVSKALTEMKSKGVNIIKSSELK